jgi:hypothetical protein
MGQLKLNPATVLASAVAPLAKEVANNNAKSWPAAPLSGDTEPALPLTPQRLELIKELVKNRSAQGPSASQIAQRFAPRGAAGPSHDRQVNADAPPASPLLGIASGIRKLTAVLIVAALLPNLTLLFFWLRAIDMADTVPVPSQENAVAVVPSTRERPVLSAPPALEATAGEAASFPLALDGTDGVPAGSVIVIRGLPRGSTLTNGRRHGETEWNLRPDEIGDLHIVPREAATDGLPISIQLVAPDGGIIADAATMLKIAEEPTASVAAAVSEIEPRRVRVVEIPVEVLEQIGSEEEEIGSEELGQAADVAAEAAETVPLPTRRPRPLASDDELASWIRPSAYVNLRQGPSSSAAVVSVVAKGTKLRVLGRKRGWVQVTNPATSDSGWIYSGNLSAAR